MIAPVINDAAASYTPGISERRSSATTYHHGGIKNAESQTNTSQTVAATQTFDAFGNTDTSSGTWKGPFSYGGPFGYQSDSDSGLMLLGHRYYDSSTGRFLTRDRIQFDRNWYVYCASNPQSKVDEDGLQFGAIPLFGIPYKTPDDAAAGALGGAFGRPTPRPGFGSNEESGWIIKLPFGGYGYTDPRDPRNKPWESFGGPRPNNGVAKWHTHPSWKANLADPDSPPMKEDFSTGDYEIMDGVKGDGKPTPGYVGYENGNVYYYEPGDKPGTGKTRKVKTWKRRLR